MAVTPGKKVFLKEAGTCRVFVSSPFGGYGEEREELVLKLFPKLRHLCQARGIQLAAVDMRWGITKEAADNAQTVNICLREIDRSDIFVGIYGQRYGWHGADELLEKNIKNAQGQYPWLVKFKDRSVSEFEFLHAHLNNPGSLPSIFAFRDKKYDDAAKAKAEKAQDEKTAGSFAAESTEAFNRLRDLKERVVKTKSKCVALMESYGSPKEGASFIYEELKKHIESVYLSNITTLTKREESLLLHDAYKSVRSNVFVGRQINTKTLDVALQKDGRAVIVGPSGSGKAALLSSWLNSLKMKPVIKPIVHFVSCSSESSGISEMILRLTGELTFLTSPEQHLQGERDMEQKSADIGDICQKLDAALVKAAQRHKIVLAIDGLGKLQEVSKTAKTLFWLPKTLPQNVTVVVTCRTEDKEELAELSARGYTQIMIAPLEKAQRKEMCKKLLIHNSKELSSSQLQKIVDTTQTESPLYLKTVVSELCSFGKFRKLDEKIAELLACKSVNELFQAFIRRLESDYISDAKKGNIIEQVMCSIRLSRKGVSEQELIAMHNLSSHEWSPLFFAIQHVLVSNSGLLTFGFTDLGKAVDNRYLKDKNTRVKYLQILAKYFQNQLKESGDIIQLEDQSVRRPAEELPWLLFTLGDKKALVDALCNLAIFGRLFLSYEFELIQLWRFTELLGEQVADAYIAVINTKIQEVITETDHKPHMIDSIKRALISYLVALSYFMEMAQFPKGLGKILMKEIQVLTDTNFCNDTDFVDRSLTQVKSKLANLYIDNGHLEQAKLLHLEVLQKRKEFLEKAKNEEEIMSAKNKVGESFQGLARLYSEMGEKVEAMCYYDKALELQQDNDSEMADNLHNIGVIYMELKNHKKALDLLTRSLELYEKMYFAIMPPAVAVMLDNIGTCHRNLGQPDEAESMYLKSIEMSERSVGRDNPQVAKVLMNLGSLGIKTEGFFKAGGFLKESISIYQKTEPSKSNMKYTRCLEMYVACLLKLENQKEAFRQFETLFPRACTDQGGLMDAAEPIVYEEMADLALRENRAKLAHGVSLALLESKHSKARSIIHYLTACKILQLEPKPDFTITKALEKSPGSSELLKYCIQTELIPSGDSAKMTDVLDKANQARKDGLDLYSTAAKWCCDANARDMLIALLEHGLTKYPDENNFVCALANEYYNREEWNKALVHYRRLVELEPNDPSHLLTVADVTFGENKLEEAKAAFNEVVAKFPTDAEATSEAKNGLQAIEAKEKKETPTKQ